MASPERSTRSNPLCDKQFPDSVNKNISITVEPRQVLFHSYRIGQTVTQSLRIINTSGKEQRFHILPLETGRFSLHYEKKRKLLPGMNQLIKITFDPKDYSKCSQTLHIHCPNEENLSIPVIACPTPELSGFPNTLHFPNTPIGKSNFLQFTLCSNIFTSFQFELIFNPPTEMFSVMPSSGSVPPEGKLQIRVAFMPNQLRTTLSNLELTLPEIDSETRICPCTGSCLPENIYSSNKPIGKSKIATKLLPKGGVKLTKRKFSIGTKKDITAASEIISKSREACHLSLRDRERDFLFEVRQSKDEENMSQLKGSTILGFPELSRLELSKLASQRKKFDKSPHFKPLNMTRIKTVKIERCKDHSHTELNHLIPYSNLGERPNWRKKQDSFSRFSLAAKRVVIQLRAERRLKCIQRCLQEQNKEKILTKPLSSNNEFILPELRVPIPFLFINVEIEEETAPSESAFIPIEISMPVIEFEQEEPTFQTIAPVYHEQQNYMKIPLCSSEPFLPVSFGKKKREGAKHEYLGVETQKREEKLSQFAEEIIETISRPYPEHLKKGPNVRRTSVIDPLYEVPAYLPMCPVTEIDPEYHLLPFKPTPFDQIRTDQTQEQKDYIKMLKEQLTPENDTISILEEVQPYLSPDIVPYYPDNIPFFLPKNPIPYMKAELDEFPSDVPKKFVMKENTPTFDMVFEKYKMPPESEKYVHIDREEEFKKIKDVESEKAKSLKTKIDARMKVVKNLMSPELIKQVPEWMW